MEKNNKENGSKVCDCAECSIHGGYHRHFWLRWVLGLAIIMIAFGLGLKVGEFKGYFESNVDRYDRGYMMWNHYPMMYNQTTAPVTTTPSASTPSTTTKTK